MSDLIVIAFDNQDDAFAVRQDLAKAQSEYLVELEDAVVVAEWGGGLVEQLADGYLHVTLDRRTHAETDARIISWRVVGEM